MREYLPILIVGAIIGSFAIVFLLAYIALQKNKEKLEDNERHMADGEIIRRLLQYAKPYWKNFVIVFFVMVFSMMVMMTFFQTIYRNLHMSPHDPALNGFFPHVFHFWNPKPV